MTGMMFDSARAYQSKVEDWANECFGQDQATDVPLRSFRFLEEALELAQVNGCSREDALKLVDYVYGRPPGVLWQEVGGVLVTLSALCTANGVDMMLCGERELARVQSKIPEIRAKNKNKPRNSPLPQ